MKNKLIGVTLLFTAALIFGCSYVASSIGMKAIEAFTFNSIRFSLGSLVLLPIVVISRIHSRSSEKNTSSENGSGTLAKKMWIGGIMMGVVLCIAAFLQQAAFNYSSSGKIAFITSLYMLFVPVLGLFLGKKCLD